MPTVMKYKFDPPNGDRPVAVRIFLGPDENHLQLSGSMIATPSEVQALCGMALQTRVVNGDIDMDPQTVVFKSVTLHISEVVGHGKN